MNYPTTYEEAEAFESHVAKLVATHIKNRKDLDANRSEPTEAMVEHLRSIKVLIPVGWYEHFKSTAEHPKRYYVSNVSEDVNTGYCYVAYAGDYGAFKDEEGLRILVGSKDSFLRPIDRPEYRGVRFKFLGTMHPDEIEI